MKPISSTPYHDVNEVLGLLLVNVKEIFQDQLVGMYIYSALSGGDYNPDTRDNELLVATTDTLPEETSTALRTMHNRSSATSRKRTGELDGASVPTRLIHTHKSNGILCPMINEGEFF